MKNIFFCLLLCLSIFIADSQNELVGMNYFKLNFCRWQDDISNIDISTRNNKPIFCDIYVVSFDSNSCIKRHIFFSRSKNEWMPVMNSYIGSYRYVNDSTICYRDSCLYSKDSIRTGLLQCLYNPDPMGKLNEYFIASHDSIIIGNMAFYPYKNLHLSLSEEKELMKILKLYKILGAQAKRARILKLNSKKDARNYVNANIKKYKGTRDYEYLGKAAHTMMDAVCPVHATKNSDGSYEPSVNDLGIDPCKRTGKDKKTKRKTRKIAIQLMP